MLDKMLGKMLDKIIDKMLDTICIYCFYLFICLPNY